MDMESARNTGAMALFGEKYGDVVRVLRIGSDSVELCGGTHVSRAGDIGLFKIIYEGGIASGVRRIEAVTGEAAVKRFIDSETTLDSAAQQLKANRDDLLPRIEQLQASNRNLEKQLEALKSKLASQTGGDLAAWRRILAVSRCWRRCSMVPTSRRCEKRSISSKINSVQLRSCWQAMMATK